MKNRLDSNTATSKSPFRDDNFHAPRNFNLGDIEVPLLSVVNWGGISLHLRGNLEGFCHAGSEPKYLRAITGRHDLPYFYPEEVEIQLSFFDAFLKGDDRTGWSFKGKLPPIDLVLRKADVGFNNTKAEQTYPRKTEMGWPFARTQYTKFHLTPERRLTTQQPELTKATKLAYRALGTAANPQFVKFTTPAFLEETEVTGYIVAHLNVSMAADPEGPTPQDIDLFITLRHLSSKDMEISYTGTTGEPVPITQGWLRVNMRKTNPEHPKHRAHLPWRDYLSTDVLPVIPGENYSVDIEIWPTNVVLDKGDTLVLEIASEHSQNAGLMLHDDENDRSEKKFKGTNYIVLGPKHYNYIILPIIPPE